VSELTHGLVPPAALGNKGGVNLIAYAARSAARHVLDFALPPRCAGCGAVVDSPHRFCLGCWQSLTFLGEPCCRRCGLPFEYDSGAESECGGCIADPPAYDGLRAAVAYGDLARKVALKLKYGGRPNVAETLAYFMQRHLAGQDKRSIIAPVPLHRWRIWQRGYNQSALIAASLARRAGYELEVDLIRRTRHTPPLKGMDRRARRLAVRGAFAINRSVKEKITGRAVILVDDVYTTGATANACADLLKRSGAAAVNIICWARVVRNEHD
jgi:ComF family protein